MTRVHNPDNRFINRTNCSQLNNPTEQSEETSLVAGQFLFALVDQICMKDARR